MKIDVFAHIAPQKFLDALLKKKEIMELPPTLYNLDLRFKFMDRFEGLVQVLSLPVFDFASFGNSVSPKDDVELCKIANEEMSELQYKYSDRFVGVCATVPMTDMDACLKEVDRAINDLGCCGIEIFTDVNGKPLDSPEFRPLFEKMNYYNLPILLHPTWRFTNPEYPGEETAKYLSVVTLTFPYQTTLALNRLVFSGIMEDYPNLKIITHHCGGLLPYLVGRIAFTYASHQVAAKGAAFKERYLPHRPSEYFHRFYGDTCAIGSKAALRCGYEFFGADHLLFGSDSPFDSQLGLRQTGDNIRGIEELGLSEEDKLKIFELNAIELFRLPLTIIE